MYGIDYICIDNCNQLLRTIQFSILSIHRLKIIIMKTLKLYPFLATVTILFSCYMLILVTMILILAK